MKPQSNFSKERNNERIERELSELLRELKDPRLSGAMLSVVRTETTADLKHCKVYVSALNPVSERDFNKGIRSATPFLRHELARRVNLRNTPELTFKLDSSIEHSVKISTILKGLNSTADSP